MGMLLKYLLRVWRVVDMDLVNIYELKKYYYDEVKKESIEILENIQNSVLQDEYRNYLSRLRRIGANVLKESYMFYILDGFDELDELFRIDNIKEITGLQTSGNVWQKERFVFPILDMRNVIMGYVGYDYESDFKYLIRTAQYVNKSKLFYNMQNLEHAYKQDVCIVSEGVFDSLRLNEVGFLNNVSLLGKRLSDFHRRVLNRFNLVIFIPDNDDEGMKASKYWSRGIDTKIAYIKLNNREIIKRKIVDGVMQEYKTTVKDIDDALTSNKEDFINLYKEIVKDSKSPFYTTKQYFL